MQTRFKYISTRSGKSLILNIENKRYVFNMFEGFQRYSIEQNVSLKGIDTVFLPDSSGIPAFLGFYLTIRDMQKNSLVLVCEKDVFDVIDKAEVICPKKDLTLIHQQDYEDEYIRVTTVNSKPRTVQDYIIEFRDIPGRLLVEKIPTELPKKFFKSLKLKNNIEFNNKLYVGKDYVEDPIQIGKVLLVFSDRNISLEDTFRAVLCFNENTFCKLKKKFKNTFHMILNDKVEFESHYRVQSVFNRIDPNYLLPVSDKTSISYGAIAVSRISTRFNTIKSNVKRKRKQPRKVKNIILNLKNHLILKANSRCYNSGDEIFYEKTEKNFVSKKKNLRYFRKQKNDLTENSLYFLGTGCALPSKYRNVSSVLYHIDGNIILFDCGEDTLSQISRLFGSCDILKKLKYIFISHSHADHCLGIINLLNVVHHNVCVLAPSALVTFLESYNFHNVTFYHTTAAKELENEFHTDHKLKRGDFTKFNFNTLVHKRGDLETIYNEVITNYVAEFEDGDFTFYICGVEHNGDSCSVSMIYKNQVKISYTGDTRPSHLFTIMAKESDAMIHESTFNHKNMEKALKTRHSTITEAQTVFNLSKSRRLFLNHFSQRYPKGFVNMQSGIPCMDFYMFTLGVSTYNKNEINEHIRSLEE